MQVSELVEVLNYLEDTLNSGRLVKLYSELISAVERYKNSKGKSAEIVVAERVVAIKEYLLSIVPLNWEPAKWSIFTAMGGVKLLGKTSINQIETVTKTPAGSCGILLEDLKKTKQELSALTERNTSLLAELEIFSECDKADTKDRKIFENDLVLKLIFKDKMTIKVISQAVKFLSMWEKVFFYVSLLTKQKGKDVFVNVIKPDTHGSNVFIVELSYNKIAVTAIVKCITQAYGLYSSTLEIKKKILEIRKLNLENKQIERALAEEEKSMVGRIAGTITATQMKEYAWDEKEFQKINKAVVVALKYLLDYIERGGEVNFYTNSDSAEYKEMHDKLFAARDRVIDLKLDIALLRS